MAARINKPFLIGVIVVAVGLVAAVGVAALMMTSQDAASYVARGDALMAEGNKDKAVEQYGKALNLDKSNVPVILKYVDGVRSLQAKNPGQARNYLTQQINWYGKALEADPSNTEVFNRLMSLYYQIATRLNDTGVYDRMYELALSTLSRDPDRPDARKWRGVAQSYRIQLVNTNAEDRETALADLTEALEANPDDRVATEALVQWHLYEANRKRVAARSPQEVAQHRNDAVALATMLAEAEPDNPRPQLDLFRVLLRAGQTDEATELIRSLEQRLLEDPTPPQAVRDVANLMPIVYRTEQDRGQSREGVERALVLLNKALETHPNNVLLTAMIGEKQLLLGEFEAALATLEQVEEIKPRGDLFELMLAGNARNNAQLQLADLNVRLAEQSTGDEREAYQDKAQDIIDTIIQRRGENGAVRLLQGKLALQRGDIGEAGNLLDQANNLFNDRNPEALRLSAMVRQQQGQLGTAAQRFEQLLRLRPGDLGTRQQLARIHLQLRNYDDAQRHIETIEEELPDAIGTKMLRAALFVAQGDEAQAIRIYRGINPSENPEVLLPLVRLLTRQERLAEARLAVEQRLDTEPADLRAVALLSSLAKDDVEALSSRIAAAEAAGAPQDGLDLIKNQISGDVSTQEQIEEVLNREEDPVRRALRFYNYYQQTNQPDKAADALATVKQTDPDNPTLIEIEFNQAIASRDWKQAQALAARAEALNLDEAGGAMFQGQLAMARGEHDRAVSYFRRGLDVNPAFSDRWRMLGDALRAVGDMGGAKQAYDRAIEQKPDNVRALRGLIAVESSFDNHATVLRLFERALGFAQNDMLLRHAYLLYMQQHGDADQALRERREIARDEPRFIQNRRSLALLLADQGNTAAALAEADAIDEQFGPMLGNAQLRAQILLSLDQPQQARQVMLEYIRGLGDEATPVEYLALAALLRRIGDTPGEYAAYQQAVALEDPQQQMATRALADRLFEVGRIAEAITRYEQLYEANPQDAVVGRRLTESYLRSDQLDKAQQTLAILLKSAKTSQEYLLQAALARAQEKPDAAMRAVNRAIEADPNNARVYQQRAELSFADPSKDQSTQSDLNRAIQLDPNDAAARRLLARLFMRQGQWREAIRELRTLVNRVPNNRAARVDLLRIYQLREQTSEARTLVRDSMRQFPGEASWPDAMAQLLEAEGQFAQAQPFREQVVAMNPTPETVGRYADNLLNQRKASQALQVLRDRVEMVNQVPLLQALRARAMVIAGRTPEATQLFRRVVERAQSIDEMQAATRQMTRVMPAAEVLSMLEGVSLDEQKSQMLNLLRAQLEVAMQDFQRAADRLDAMAPPEPEDSPMRAAYDRLLALSLQQTGQHSRSRAAYEHLLTISPDDVTVLNNLAFLLADQLNEPQEAVRLARRAVELAPGNATILDTLGWCLYKNGELVEARQVLEQSLDALPLPHNTYHLALVLIDQGDPRQARGLLEQAVALAQEQNEATIAKQAREQLEAIRNSTGQAGS